MDDVFVYIVDLPPNVREMIAPCFDGFTVYIDAKLSHEEQLRAYRHAMNHIINKDWEKSDVGSIESRAHRDS